MKHLFFKDEPMAQFLLILILTCDMYIVLCYNSVKTKCNMDCILKVPPVNGKTTVAKACYTDNKYN